LSKKKTSSRHQDPFLARERARYSHPLPSRELILEVLREQGVPLAEQELARLLEITENELPPFTRRLQAMEREGQVVRNRKDAICMPDKLSLVSGRVEGHPDGFGFVVPDDNTGDLFLSPKEMRKVLHGDRVLVRPGPLDRRGRREGAIVDVLQRANQRLVGRFFKEHGVCFVSAEDKRISREVQISPEGQGGAAVGSIVTVELLSQPSEFGEPIGRVVEVLGNYADPGMEIEIALRKHQLPFVWPAAVEALAKKMPKRVRKTDLLGREDIRDLPLVTIDGESAKDFDDAVYCEPVYAGAAEGKRKRVPAGYRLLVAIADVSHYVRPGDALDQEGKSRGNSVYFPRRVIPMLPEELSNGLCSLNPAVDRLCMVCDMAIDKKGKVERYRFYSAVMHSRARLTYTEVAAMLEAKRVDREERAELLPHLENLHALFKVLHKARTSRGAIDFDTVETEMEFDDRGKILRIRPAKRNDAHRLIEECMLAANVCASDFLNEHRHPTLYRVHAGPNPEKLEGLREFLAEFGLHLGGGDTPKAKDYAHLLEKVKERADAGLIQTVMLRSLMQAVYSPENLGHFGLAYDAYAHFTSPIRRYPDLLVHRAIKAVLAKQLYDPGSWKELGVHCSQTERRADEASRDVSNWLKCYYMQDRVGDVFSSTITGVAGFGVFVTLTELFVEGLVHISELGSDYFHFDPPKHQLLGERTGQRYRLSDSLSVRLVRVDLEQSKLEFVPAAAGREIRQPARRRRAPH
jgi:ribonuclease R